MEEEIDSDLGIKMVFGCVVQSEIHGKVLRGGELGGRVVEAEEISRVSKAMGSLVGRDEEARSSRECKGEGNRENHISQGDSENETVHTLHSLNGKRHTDQEADLLGLCPGFVIYRVTWARPSSLPLCPHYKVGQSQDPTHRVSVKSQSINRLS